MNKIFKNTFFLIILAELLSFLGYYYPTINLLAFFVIAILVLISSLYRLEYGLYILLTELFIGSFGYLFYFKNGGFQISIRLALWLIIMSVWLAKIIAQWLKMKKLNFDFLKDPRLAPFIVLFIFIGWGLVDGLMNGNSPSHIFFDFNNWLYFLLIFPVFAVWRDNSQFKILKSIFLAAITWLSVKTIILAYIFTHNFNGLDLEIYGWIRADGLGEITPTAAGFSRIFMQSQIFVLIGFFILLFYLLTVIASRLVPPAGGQGGAVISRTSLVHSSEKKSLTVCFLWLTLFLSAIIISFSRSFWLGLAAGGITIWLIAIFKLKIKFKQFIIFNSIILFIIILSLILTVAVIKFPYPSAYGGFNPADLLSQRATQITNEAGASSRWRLLPPLWQKIKTAPILGRGFGATVTYRTNDPRVLAVSPDGLYTTYTFEWGWLDIWLKLGLFGLLVYLFLFIKIIKDGLSITPFNKGPSRRSEAEAEGGGDLISLSLTAGLIVLMAVNIFSPYVNHPLGIGYLILVAVFISPLACPPRAE